MFHNPLTKSRFLKVDPAGEDDEEENAREKWLTSLSASLLGDGKKSFLDAVSKCLSLGKSDLVRVCLTTVAWLSFSLASLHDTRYQLSAFSALISPLKQYLEYGVLVEQRILASLSLLNFSTIPGQLFSSQYQLLFTSRTPIQIQSNANKITYMSLYSD